MVRTHGLDSLGQIPAGAVLAIGNFDGVHVGHRRILDVALGYARELKTELVVITFEPHPLTVLAPERAPLRLTPFEIKHGLLQRLGVNRLIVLPPEPGVLNLSAEDFWLRLRDGVKPSHIVEGASFNFGKGRGGNAQKLLEWSATSAVNVTIVPPVQATLLDMSIVPISSSLIRWLIGQGRVRDAARLLGSPYTLQGKVVMGHQRGRTIGVPTANLDVQTQLAPGAGVYAGRCLLDGNEYTAAVSVGTMPTFGENAVQIEAHLIGFSGDIYGKTVQLELLDWIRDQRKFPSIDVLKYQLGRDILQAHHVSGVLSTSPAGNRI